MPYRESLVFVPKQNGSPVAGQFPEEARTSISTEYLSAQMREARLKDLGKVTNKHFTTVFHKSVYRELTQMLIALRDGSYVDKSGNFTKILMGPRGIAKTTCLRNFASTAPLLASNVASLLVSYTAEGSIPAEIASGEITSICGRIAKSFGWSTEEIEEDETRPDFIVRKLEEQDTKLVLIVDEVDQLLKASENDSTFFQFAKSTLSDLARLGNNICGRLMIVVSGSSSRLRTFIKGSISEFSDQEKADYKMLSQNLNMNSHRYKTLIVTYPRPDSLADALAILHPTDNLASCNSADLGQELIEEARNKMFERGCNPRALDDPISVRSEGVLPKDHSCCKLWMQLLVLWYGYPVNRKLLVILGKRAQSYRDWIWQREAWSTYRCDACRKEKKKCSHAIGKYSWELQFKPVSLDRMHRSRGPELSCQLDKLQFEGYIVDINGDIYPSSLGLYVKNLSCWSTSLDQLLRRRYAFFCTSPQNHFDLLDDLSVAAKDLVKEALRNGVF